MFHESDQSVQRVKQFWLRLLSGFAASTRSTNSTLQFSIKAGQSAVYRNSAHTSQSRQKSYPTVAQLLSLGSYIKAFFAFH